ncbi:adenine phosphoribosyltransferase [Klebsiella pneumoniae]|nr:adenine phosphoribosyltransferase [Klebsiella pneumoniae]
MTATAQQLEQHLKEQVIQSIEDYPKPGILFRDVTSLLEDSEGLRACSTEPADRALQSDAGITKVVGTGARGFLFGALLVALALGAWGFVPARKPRKLPRETIAETYELEYGTDQLEIHVDAIKPGHKVLVVDDLLATGGTIDATVKLIRRLGGEVHDAAFIIGLFDLGAANSAWRKLGIHCYCLGAVPGPLQANPST